MEDISENTRARQLTEYLDEEILTSPETKSETIHYSPTSCRVCLNDGDIHIFHEDCFGDISQTLFTITGVRISKADNLPKYLCHSCNEQLQSAILLRQIAQETDTFLKKDNECDISYDEDITQFEQCTKNQTIFKDCSEERDTNYKCRKCDVQFKCSYDYGTHMLTDEHKQNSDTCPFCLREFKCIVTHLRLHTVHKTISCNICHKKFLKPVYNVHRESHFDNLPLKCPECPYQGRFRGDFKVHLRKHTGEKPYKCKHCPYRFTNKSNLNRHLLTHEDSYRFNCDICKRSFLAQREFDEHVSVHLNLRPFPCAECNRKFVSRKALTRHLLRVHKREKMRSGRIPNYIRVQTQPEIGSEEYLII